jgi:hypothetical protein
VEFDSLLAGDTRFAGALKNETVWLSL